MDASAADIAIAASPACPAPLLAAPVRRACERGLRPLVVIPVIVPRLLPAEALDDLGAPAALALEHAALCALQGRPGTVEVVPCRSLGALLQTFDRLPPTLLAGHAGWALRRALHRRGVPLAALWPPSS